MKPVKFFLCVLCVLCVGVRAQQNDASARRAAERLQALQREADRLASDERTLLGDLRKLEIERQLNAGELRRMDAEIANVQRELTATSTHIAELESADAAARPRLNARIVELYKLGPHPYLRMLLSTSDVRRLGQASRTVAALAALDRQRVVEHQRTIQDLKSSRAALESRKQRLAALRVAAERAQAETARAAKARNDLVRDIDAKRDVNAQLSSELVAAQQRLQATIGGLSSAPTTPAPLPLAPFRGDLDWPAPGRVERAFGRVGASVSNGIEITTPEGADVRAVHEGTVVYAGTFAGYGNLVIVDHGSQTFSVYGDLLEIAVQKGARVDRGQPLGSAGPTRSAAAGLYFELRVDGRAVDPLQWLKKP